MRWIDFGKLPVDPFEPEVPDLFRVRHSSYVRAQIRRSALFPRENPGYVIFQSRALTEISPGVATRRISWRPSSTSSPRNTLKVSPPLRGRKRRSSLTAQ